MLDKIRILIARYKHLVLYCIFGALTTFVNYIVFFPLYNVAHFSATLSNGISWGVAVLVAFLTNKTFVFKSKDWSAGKILPEFVRFTACRMGSGILETGVLFFAVDLLQYNGNLCKIIVSVMNIVLNYIFSKFFVFQNYKNTRLR